MLLKVTGCLLIHIRLTIITIVTGFWLRFCSEDYNHSKFRKPAIRTTVNRRTSDRGPKKTPFLHFSAVRIEGFALGWDFAQRDLLHWIPGISSGHRHQGFGMHYIMSYFMLYYIYYRVFIKYCVFFLKMLWFFWILQVLLQRWCSTCLVCVHTLTRRKARVWNILKS